MQKSKLQFKIQNYFIGVLAALLLMVLAVPVFAANIFFDAKNQSFAQGEEFLMQVFLNTEGEEINAVEGKLIFPPDLLEAKEIRDGNSIINFWIEKPNKVQATNIRTSDVLNEIQFSGITPGGFEGEGGFVFAVVFRAKTSGSGAIEIQGAKVLLNDAAGTPAKTRILNFEFRILKAEGQIPDSKFQIPEDTDPPEDFRPEIASDPNIFDGKYFVVFATQDKGSGIDHYEVREGWWNRFLVAESPYLLQNQKLDQKIVVKAIDKAGNERIAVVEPRYPLKWYEIWWIWGMIAITGIVMSLIWRKFKNE